MKEFKFIFNKLPFYVIFYPTSRCNARCPHCFNYARQENSDIKNELRIDEIERISNNFGHIKVLTITGGEPFLRGDLYEIVSIFHKNNSLQYVSFHTNGFIPDRVYDTVYRVLSSFPRLQVIVCISIDNIGSAHDKFRGIENGFSMVVETIDKLKMIKKTHNNLNLITNTIFSNSTAATFRETINFIQQNIKGVKPTLGFIRADVKDPLEKDIDYKKYEDFHRELAYEYRVGSGISPFSPMAFKEAAEALVSRIVVDNYRCKIKTIPCHAGHKLLVIYENGDVYPCEMLKERFGNLREADYDIKNLLFSEKSRNMLAKIRIPDSCYCTWENIIPVNLIFSPRYYYTIISKWIELFFLKNNNRKAP